MCGIGIAGVSTHTYENAFVLYVCGIVGSGISGWYGANIATDITIITLELARFSRVRVPIHSLPLVLG